MENGEDVFNSANNNLLVKLQSLLDEQISFLNIVSNRANIPISKKLFSFEDDSILVFLILTLVVKQPEDFHFLSKLPQFRPIKIQVEDGTFGELKTESARKTSFLGMLNQRATIRMTRVENRQRTPTQSKVYAIVPIHDTVVTVPQTMPLGYQVIFHCILVLSSVRGVLHRWTMFSLATRGNKKDEKLFRINRCLWRRQEKLNVRNIHKSIRDAVVKLIHFYGRIKDYRDALAETRTADKWNEGTQKCRIRREWIARYKVDGIIVAVNGCYSVKIEVRFLGKTFDGGHHVKRSRKQTPKDRKDKNRMDHAMSCTEDLGSALLRKFGF
ncbi:hypothetical protein HZH68_000987 [Vespula germanica]|uniref:Uncharacterized protein n=1 Tax=Vespula germanica TaxID=30212 RepID=A0A834NUQ2_VESGE|nr:hypothetical protein HZH68_000987 [Vespula germanica]